jgi:hypothetical protein
VAVNSSKKIMTSLSFACAHSLENVNRKFTIRISHPAKKKLMLRAIKALIVKDQQSARRKLMVLLHLKKP